MAVTVDWDAKVINVPKADTTLILAGPPQEIREYDLDAFRLELKALEAGAEGMPFLDTHSHNPEVTVGGVTLARVVEIINGYTITFEDGQYAVNLFGANSNVGDVVNVNQVSIRSANSAGLINVDNAVAEIRYQGFVWLSSTGTAGVDVGINGTPTNPVDTLADALTIAAAGGIRGLWFLDSAWTLSASLTNFHVGMDATASLDTGSQDVTGTAFQGGALTGTMTGGPVTARRCAITDFDGFLGTASECGLEGTVGLGVGVSTLHQCYSRVPGVSMPTLDVVGGGRDCGVRDYVGGLAVINMTDSANLVSLDYSSGQCNIDASCTDGTLVVRGQVGPLVDSSAGTTVVTTGRTNPQALTDVWQLLGLDPGAELVIDGPLGDGAANAGAQNVGDITLTITQEATGGRVRVLRTA